MRESRDAYLPQLVTKADLGLVTGEMTALKTDTAVLSTAVGTLTSDMAGLKGDVATLKTDVTALRGELASTEARLEAKIAGLKADLLKWLVPLLAGQMLGMLALVARAYLPG